MTTTSGQHLFVTTVLPADAATSVEASPDDPSGASADNEPMLFRLKVEAPGGRQETRSLHVLQGTGAEPAANRSNW